MRGKRIKNAKDVVTQKSYSLKETTDFYCTEYKKFKANFDESIELTVLIKKYSKQTQSISGIVKTSSKTGKNKKLACFVAQEEQELIRSYGADIVGSGELIEKINNEKSIDFDICLSTSDMMPLVTKIAKQLGPKGLMPNPKFGTVLDGKSINADVIEGLKTRHINFRMDKHNRIACVVGKISIGSAALHDNIMTVIRKITDFRGDKMSKHNFIKSIYVSSTHGPSLELDFVDILK